MTRERMRLYRRILETHRALPPQHKKLGDAMAKAEFRKHANADESFLLQFERQWRDYLTVLRNQLASEPSRSAPASAHTPAHALGRELSDDELAALSAEQRVSLFEALERKPE